ncbi:MAG: helix-turn-helix domain-containing protein, partial [Candidatus Nealsonbacteria bacterium]|nr:helix-turn-helix domain-containing protein [Candidatus Nealsonbacteria bacterium]
MAKSLERNKAIDLRKKGNSINEIAKKINISKSTVSCWCRDIELSAKQIKRLTERIAMKGSYKNRLKGARVQHERRLKEIEELNKKGLGLINEFSLKEILVIGIALYWGEGMK